MVDHALYHAALKADHAWQAELTRMFGKRAGDVRYTKQGEGKPGTVLNDTFLVFREANDKLNDEWKRIQQS
jgi:hypothetical protein